MIHAHPAPTQIIKHLSLARINKAYRLECVTRAAIISSRQPPARAMHRTVAAGQIIAHLIGKVKNARGQWCVRSHCAQPYNARHSRVTSYWRRSHSLAGWLKKWRRRPGYSCDVMISQDTSPVTVL